MQQGFIAKLMVVREEERLKLATSGELRLVRQLAFAFVPRVVLCYTRGVPVNRATVAGRRAT